MGTSGSVAYMFERKGIITVKQDGVDEDELTLAAIDAGAARHQVLKTMSLKYTPFVKICLWCVQPWNRRVTPLLPQNSSTIPGTMVKVDEEHGHGQLPVDGEAGRRMTMWPMCSIIWRWTRSPLAAARKKCDGKKVDACRRFYGGVSIIKCLLQR